MSSKNFKALQPKSIYNNLEFFDEPYSQTDKFNVFIPKEVDYVGKMIEKDRQAQQSKVRVVQLVSQEREEQSRLRNRIQQDIQTDTQINANEPVVQVQSAKNIRNREPRNQSPKGILKKHQTPKLHESVSSKGFRTTTDFKHGMLREKELRRLRESLYFDERTKTVPKSTIRNNIIEDIVQDGDVFLSKQELMGSIYKLKQLNLLKNHEMNVNRFPGIGKVGFVFNDYHSKSTNNGYSRNFGGVFYTR